MIEIINILDVERYIDDVDAVIFDLDDTLYSEKDYVRSGFREISKYFNIPSMEDELWTIFEKGGKPIDVILDKYQLLDMKNIALNIYRYHIPNIEVYPGVSEMIERIKLTKKLGIITDGRVEGQKIKLKVLNLNIDEVVITDELGGIKFRKPNIIPFVHIQKKLNVPFDKMVYIGDNKTKDFIAPNKLGMKSIWFKNKEGLYFNKS